MPQQMKSTYMAVDPATQMPLGFAQTTTGKPPTQQDITSAAVPSKVPSAVSQAVSSIAQKMQAPAEPQPQSILPGFTPFLNTPKGMKMEQELDVARNAARDEQRAGLGQYEDLLNAHLEKSKNQQLDLSPLLALTDTWTGSRLASGYKKPTDSKTNLETTAALQQGLQKAKGALTDDEAQYLANKIGMRQKVDDEILKGLVSQNTLASQEERARERVQQEIAKNGGMNLTPGQKATDVKFSDDHVKWMSGGANSVDKNLGRLRTARARVAEAAQTGEGGISGRIIGRLPNALRPEESIMLQQEVQGAAMGSLKDTLGTQFTDSEGQRIMSVSYDPTLSPAENLKKIDAALAELEDTKRQKEDLVREFGATGTLKNFRFVPFKGTATPPEKKPQTREEKIEELKRLNGGG